MENHEEFKKLLDDYIGKENVRKEMMNKLTNGFVVNKQLLDKYLNLKTIEDEAHQKWLEFMRK